MVQNTFLTCISQIIFVTLQQISNKMKQHFAHIDSLRVIATILVLLIHVSLAFITNQSLSIHNDGFFSYYLIHCLSSCAVAIFVLITGFLLLSKQEPITYSTILTRYMPRILWTLLIFALPMCLIEQVVSNPHASIATILSSSILHFLTGSSWAHMWYLYMLLGLYLIIPLLHTYILHSSPREQTQLAVALAVLGIILPNIDFFTGAKLHGYMMLPSFIATGYLGYYIAKYCPDNRRSIIVSFLLLVLYTVSGVLITLYDKQIADPEFILSIAVAGSLFCILRRWPLCSRFARWLAPHCFCIYIVHPVFLNILFKVVHIQQYSTPYPVLNTIAITGVLFLLSLLTSYLLRLIPFLRNRVL